MVVIRLYMATTSCIKSTIPLPQYNIIVRDLPNATLVAVGDLLTAVQCCGRRLAYCNTMFSYRNFFNHDRKIYKWMV